MTTIDESITVDAAEFCKLTGETIEGLAVFIAEGVLKPDAEGRFLFVASVRAVTRYWQDVIDGKLGGHS